MFPFRTKSIRTRSTREAPSTRRHIVYGVLLITAVVLVSSLVWYLTRREAVTVRDIEISGGETIPNEEIHAVVDRELAGNYLLLVPHRFAYLYPHDRILAAVLDVPRVRTATVERISRIALRVKFEEYVPYALWCLNEAEDAPCAFMDSEGFAFTDAPPLRGGAFLRHVLEGVEKIEERQMLDRNSLTESKLFTELLESKLNFRVHEVVHDENGDERYKLGGGGEILIAKGNGAETSFGQLQAIIASKEFDHLEPGNFKYIDLRFGNKIFVNEVLEEPEPVASTSVSAASTTLSAQ